MSAAAQVQQGIDQIVAGALFVFWLVTGIIAVRIALRIYRARRPPANSAPEPDTLPYRNARGLADWQRKKTERYRTGAEP